MNAQGACVKFIQVSDLHLVAPGERLQGLDPLERLRACVAHINANHADAAFVAFTGDLADDGDPRAYAALSAALAGLRPPAVLMAGNHDSRDALLAAFPHAADSHGFVQGVRDAGGQRFIFLDTLNAGRVEGRLCATRMAWLREQLKAAGALPVYLFTHHPPFRIHMPPLDACRLLDDDELLDLCRAHGQVRHIFSGHVHRTVHGVRGGIAWSAIKGTNHQSALQFDPVRFITSLEPPEYALVLAQPQSVVVHHCAFLEGGAEPAGAG